MSAQRNTTSSDDYSIIKLMLTNEEIEKHRNEDGHIYNHLEPYVENIDSEMGYEVIEFGIIKPSYKESMDEYIRFLEDTLDGMGVTIHRDVKGEIFICGSQFYKKPLQD